VRAGYHSADEKEYFFTILKKLIPKHIDTPNLKDETVIHYSCANTGSEAEEIVRFLISCGATIHSKNKFVFFLSFFLSFLFVSN
jgi:hypothetical protein